MTTLTYSTTLSIIECGSCGIPFGVPDSFIAERKDDHRTWYCPNGHSRYYPAESDAEKYQRLYKAAQDDKARLRAERDQVEASRRAWKGQATRARKAVLAGQCPFCGQHLRDIERHVSRMHTDEAAKPETEPAA